MRILAGFVAALLLMSQASAQVLTVTLLGTGVPSPEAERFGTAILVETPDKDRLLFDAGRGAAMRLHQLQVFGGQLDHVFITHLHYDHLVGLDDVWLVARLWQRKKPLNVSGPAGTATFVDHLKQAYVVDRTVRHRQSGLPLETGDMVGEDIEPGQVYARGDLTVTAFEVDHGHVKPAFGYRVDYGPRSVVISGDTTYSENLLQFAKGADVVIHEVMTATDEILAQNPRLKKIGDYHTNPQQVARLFEAIAPKLGILTHVLRYGVSEEQLMEEVRGAYAGDVHLGEDLMAVDIGESVLVYRRQ